MTPDARAALAETLKKRDESIPTRMQFVLALAETLDDRSLDDLRQGVKEGTYRGDPFNAPDDCETHIIVTRGELRAFREVARVLAQEEPPPPPDDERLLPCVDALTAIDDALGTQDDDDPGSSLRAIADLKARAEGTDAMRKPKAGAWSYAYHTEVQEPPSFVLHLTAEEMLILWRGIVPAAVLGRIRRTVKLVDQDCGSSWRIEAVRTGAHIQR